MAIGLGRRSRDIAVLSAALSALVGGLPGQPLRDQIRDIAAIIQSESEEMADELDEDDGDGSLTADEIRVAS